MSNERVSIIEELNSRQVFLKEHPLKAGLALHRSENAFQRRRYFLESDGMKRIGRLWAAVAVGVLAGLGLFTFHYAEGLSYFRSDARACLNCHLMQPQFDSWQKASHHTAASCVDCHLPQTFPAKYIAKSDNGYRHSKGFTFQDFPEPIVISKSGARILQENCLRCHDAMVHDLTLANPRDASFRCVHCHASVGHGERTGMGRWEPISLREENNP